MCVPEWTPIVRRLTLAPSPPSIESARSTSTPGFLR